MNFIDIQMEQWLRKAHYEHYKNNIPCSFSITVDTMKADSCMGNMKGLLYFVHW